MKSLPFNLIEDSADALDGNLSAPPPPVKRGTGRQSKRQVNRLKALLPGGVPRYCRVYDNGGESCDRYTAVYSGQAGVSRCVGCAPEYNYRAMSGEPFHPQGFGQWGSTKHKPCDVDRWGFPPAMGRKNHLGRRIPFTALPEDCRKLVLRDYCELWELPTP